MRYALVLPTRARNFKVFTLIGKQRLVTLASVAALLVVAALAAVAQTPRPAGPSKDAGGASAFRAQTTVPVRPLGPGPLLLLPAVDYDSGGIRALSAALADSNGDGKPGLVVADGMTSIGTATLSGGVGTFKKANFAAGTHSITATYGGDGMSAGSASATLSQVVQ
jgi:hypothetical protein